MCFKSYYSEKKLDCFTFLRKFFLQKVVCDDVSVNAGPCSSLSRKPLNKKSQDCLECCAQLKSRLPVICLCALGQYITSSFLVQCCLRRVDIAFTGYFPHKHCLSAILANIVQVISLCSVGSDRSIQNCRLFSCAELFVDCGSTLQS